MKKILVALLLCVLSAGLLAEERYEGLFLFDDFKSGKVIYKSGSEVGALLNYNKIDEKMYFIMQDPDSTILELTMTSLISDVIVDGRTFEHIKEGQFYERIKIEDNFFYIQWKSSLVSKGKYVGYGIYSSTGSIDDASRAFGHSTNRELMSSEKFKTNPHNNYYLKSDGKFKRFNSFDSLAKQFKKQEKAIKEYVKVEKLNFNNVDDIKKAVLYCFQITK